jgi:hypothetical protein
MVRRVRVMSLAVLLLVTGSVMASVPASAVIGGSRRAYGPWAVRVLVDGKPVCTGTADTPVNHQRLALLLRARSAGRSAASTCGRAPLSARCPAGAWAGAHADMMLINVPPMKVRTARLATARVHPGEVVRLGRDLHRGREHLSVPSTQAVVPTVVRPDAPRCHGFTAPGGSDFCMAKVSGIPRRRRLRGAGDEHRPAQHRNLLGVFDVFDRQQTAEAGESAACAPAGAACA